jgi:ribosomal protein S18 acetylase RimI-like enzyme
VTIRLAQPADWPRIWPIWHAVVSDGDTYVWPPETSMDDGRALWMLPSPAEVWAVDDEADGIVATATLKPNQVGLGDHVANASFMVDPSHAGRGVGRRLAEAVLERARELGYEAMQFNAVVATNERAVALWRSLGFDVVGTIPNGFRHTTLGPVDLLIMHRKL